MPQIIGERAITINASAEKIFSYIRDFTRHTEWNYRPTTISKISKGPIEIGSKFQATEAPMRNTSWLRANLFTPITEWIFGVKHSESEIVILEPNKKLAWKAAIPSRFGETMRATWEIQLVQHGSSTEVIQRFHYSPQKIATDLQTTATLAEEIGTEVEHGLQKLKTILEN